ncbi:hypothetical protein GCM10010123_35460 [Pilimelia anulata]|uniref:Uncharacterized protein n=1 Tax=Pilimelia anulata TaxID=53371 RepID=A0A8J3FEY5_9ACTN|nr:hypothetical protein [Pilimelia anulata]GGK02422.1 hypothetical protein GCM10010123_35460 [Pilimelia anulata]
MTAATDASTPTRATTDGERLATRPARERLSRKLGAYVLGAVAAAGIGGLLGWQAPAALHPLFGGDHVGAPVARLAADLGCTDLRALTRPGTSTYRYHERGTCVLGGTRLTVITFDRASDVTAFTAMMNGVVPLLHPTWSGATIATGDGWVAFDQAAMSGAAAEAAVAAAGEGRTHVIP